MIRLLLLTPELRELLSRPLGQLIPGSPEETMKELKKIVHEERPPVILAVGDATSYEAYKSGLNPHVFIVDNVISRSLVTTVEIPTDETLTLQNQRGTINEDAWEIIQKAVDSGKTTKIVVYGEEDLLTLVAILTAPISSFVIYGQPNEGLVLVRVTRDTKKTVSNLIERMDRVPNERLN